MVSKATLDYTLIYCIIYYVLSICRSIHRNKNEEAVCNIKIPVYMILELKVTITSICSKYCRNFSTLSWTFYKEATENVEMVKIRREKQLPSKIFAINRRSYGNAESNHF